MGREVRAVSTLPSTFVLFYNASFPSPSTRFYYQSDLSRLSTCPVTIHALLHIADSILKTGPVWTAWAFPMERYCGALQPAIRSRRFPYSSLNRYVLDRARLTHIKVVYDLHKMLALCPEHRDTSTSIPGCAADSESILTSPKSDILMILLFCFR